MTPAPGNPPEKPTTPDGDAAPASDTEPWRHVVVEGRFHEDETGWRHDPLVYIAGVHMPRRFRVAIKSVDDPNRWPRSACWERCIAWEIENGTFYPLEPSSLSPRVCSAEHEDVLGRLKEKVPKLLAMVHMAIGVAPDGSWDWAALDWSPWARTPPGRASRREPLVALETAVKSRLQLTWIRDSVPRLRLIAERFAAARETGRPVKYVLDELRADPDLGGGRTTLRKDLAHARELGLLPYDDDNPAPQLPSWLMRSGINGPVPTPELGALEIEK